MNPTAIAKQYLLSFFGVKPLPEMKPLLATDLKFTGSFYQYQNAADYLDSLKENMPENAINYEIIKEIEKENTCCLVYRSKKKDEEEEVMAQLFEINDDKITTIRLILDASTLL